MAPPIPSNRLPKKWSWCPIVLLGPVANEVDPKLLAQFPRSLVGLSVQGWLRQWDREGRVFASPPVLPKETAGAQVVFLSRQDLPPGETPNSASLDNSILILAEGKRGARFRWRGRWYSVPAYPACSADVTGAGDVFAAAFLVRYHQCGDPVDAALYASAASSLKVEASGADGVPDGRQVEERMSTYPQHQVVLHG